MVQANHLFNAAADISNFVRFPIFHTTFFDWFISISFLIANSRIILLKRVVAWFFQRKLNRNAQKLKELRAEKKKTIEQVMDKETYKVALEILNRFGDAATRAQHQPIGAGKLVWRKIKNISFGIHIFLFF